MVSPAVEQLSVGLAGRLKVVKVVKVVKVNVDDAPEVTPRFGATSIPTLLVLSAGATAHRIRPDRRPLARPAGPGSEERSGRRILSRGPTLCGTGETARRDRGLLRSRRRYQQSPNTGAHRRWAQR